MKIMFLLILLRILFASGIQFALPYSHMTWGEPYPGDGQQAFGIIALFFVIGTTIAFIYFVAGTVVQYLLRQRSPRWTVISDFVIFVLIFGLLVFGGITAHYT